MRLVLYRRAGKNFEKERPRVALARDETPESDLIDLEAARPRMKLKVADIPKGATVKDIIGLPDSARTRLSRAVRQLFRDMDQDLRLRERYIVDRADIRLLPPIPDPEKIVCIGQNYRDHCKEQNAPIPKSPIIFAKFATSLVGHEGTVVLPRISEKVDFEAELAFVIGKEGRHVSREDAYKHVAGYMALNDVSARDLQFGDGQWIRGKSCETFAPCGPALVTRDEIKDPQNLGISLILNDRTMQSSNTRNLIFDVPCLVEFLSTAFTLKPGDIVTTGTPPGVGCFRKPPIFLRDGDVMTVYVEKIGHVTSHVVAEPTPARGKVRARR